MNEQLPRHGPIAWVKRHPIATLLNTLFFAGVGTLIGLDCVAERRLVHQINSIRADGEPTDHAQLRSLNSPINRDANLALALVDAVQPYMSVNIPDERRKHLLPVGDPGKIATGEPAPAEWLESARWYLNLHPDAIEKIHEACKRETGWCELHWPAPLEDQTLDGPNAIRHAGRILALEASAAAEAGDASVASKRLLDLYRCAHAYDEHTYLPTIASLSRLGIVVTAEDRTERIINRCSLDPEALTRIQKEIQHWCSPFDLHQILVIERLYNMQAFGEMRNSMAGNYRVMRMMYGDPQADSIEVVSELMATLDVDESELRPAFDTWRDAFQTREYSPLADMAISNTITLVDLRFRYAAQSRALLAAIACERFRLKYNHWPESLAELVPEFLPDVPIDLFDGKPIRFAVIPEGIKVWSIGDDRTDDGGDVMRLEARMSANQRIPKDIGWVILNPDRRGAAAE